MESINHKTEIQQNTQLFTLHLLLESLFNEVYLQEQERIAISETKRETNHLIRLLSWALDYFQDFEGLDDADIRNKIESEVSKDDFLFTYAYFLSINENFNYHWSYLRKQMEGFIQFIYHFYVYLRKVVQCLNQMYPVLRDYSELVIDFSDFLKIKFSGTQVKDTKYELVWHHLKKIILAEHEFYVTVWHNNNALFCTGYDSSSDSQKELQAMLDAILRLFSLDNSDISNKEE